ncbi:hypothetical protein MUU72_30890 [Streptomyces sp. RS10V-4]|uniref:hypothetical protein n=1 Tax=Streptomyces rhizoryzae TaxID=2932493 RepID=UPI002006B792|nr:hypothetical protein [Streptomyces rhizoryzae]MCK7627452.1 hypothetical protein [Streptomyces rhizoryzae]
MRGGDDFAGPQGAAPDPGWRPPPDRKETEARRMLWAGPWPPVPPDLAVRAAARGRRLRLRRRLLHRAGSLLALLALLALALWAAVEQPWHPPPARTTPAVEGY